jgi:hypothetical protein
MADNTKDTRSEVAPEDVQTGEAQAETESPFVDDIIIWCEGLSAPRKLTKAQLTQLPRLDPALMPPINSLIQQGVTIAAIPTTSGIGAACYLVNLASLKKPQ